MTSNKRFVRKEKQIPMSSLGVEALPATTPLMQATLEWLKVQRLHKYWPVLSRMNYATLIGLREDNIDYALKCIGANATELPCGARGRLLKCTERLRSRSSLLQSINAKTPPEECCEIFSEIIESPLSTAEEPDGLSLICLLRRKFAEAMVTHWPQILQTPGIEDMLLAFFSRVLLRVKDDHFARADRFPTPPTSGSDSPSSSADSQPKVVTSRPDAWHPIPSPVAARAPTENSNVSENTSGHLREGCVKQRSSIIWPPFPPLRSPWNGNQSFQNTAPIPSRTGLNQTTGIGFQKGAARCFASGDANSLHLPPQTAKITGTGKCGGPHPNQVIQQHDDFVQNLPSHFWNNIWSTPNPQPPTLYPTLMPMPRTSSRFFPNPPPSQPLHTNKSISVSTQTTPPNDWSSRSFYSGPPVFETLWPKEKVSWKFMEPVTPRQKFQPQEKREADQKLQNPSQDMNMHDLEAVKDFLKLVRSLDVQFDLGGICRKMMDNNA